MRVRDVMVMTAVVAVVFGLAVPFGGAGEPVPCVSDCECEPGLVCMPEGECGAIMCPRLWDPVCGLDGKTYANGCELRVSHVAAAYPGECRDACMGFGGLPCPEGMYCELPVGECDSVDIQGVCEPKPEVCTFDYRPVCGCDGKTYGNDCNRKQYGVQKAHDGACGEDSVVPLAEREKCFKQTDCPKRMYCAFEPGSCGKGSGVCLDFPEACFEIFAPVCGCDGVTYPNDCRAAMKRQSVRHAGPCESGGEGEAAE